MNRTLAMNDESLRPWGELLSQLSRTAKNLTIGLVSGSRLPNERRVLERLAHTGLASASRSDISTTGDLSLGDSSLGDSSRGDLTHAASTPSDPLITEPSRGDASSLVTDGLLVRLTMGSGEATRRQLRSMRASDRIPTPVRSPLGLWNDIALSMPLGPTAPPNLERLPRWLAAWKRQYRRILVDIGPLDQPICRVLGRYCDCCILLLGPETCASPSWIRRHLDHLTQCDACVTGSIVVASELSPLAAKAA